MTSKRVRIEAVLGASLLLLATSASMGATRVFDFECSPSTGECPYGVADQTCANKPPPPLFNRPEYSSTNLYTVEVPTPPALGPLGAGACEGSNIAPSGELFGSDSYLTGTVNFTKSDRLTFSWDTKLPLRGMNWTDATKELTATGAFTNLTDPLPITINLTAGTGVTTGAYTITTKVSNDTVVLAEDINGTGGDITSANVAGWVLQTTMPPSAWTRVITQPYSWAVPLFATPTVHVGPGSSVSMKIAAYGFQADGLTPVTTAEGFEISWYIRETDRNLPLGEAGGTSGAVELVGADSMGVLGDSGTPVGGVAVNHRNFAGSSIAWTTVTWTFKDTDADTFADKVDVSVDGGPPVEKSIIGVAGTGNDGILNPPTLRGTLDSLLIRRQTTDTTSKRWFVWIDDLTIDAPGINDPLKIVEPVKAGDAEVKIEFIDPLATEVSLWKGAVGSEVLVVPAQEAPFDDPDPLNPNPHPLEWTFTGITGLMIGDRLTARQVVDGVPSDFSAEVIVAEAGSIENFDGEFCASWGAPYSGGQYYKCWYDPSSILWTYGQAGTMTGTTSTCLDISDGGWSNGKYAIFEKQLKAIGSYHVRATIHVVEGTATDAFDLYQLGVAFGADAVHPSGGAPVPGCPYHGDYTGLTPANDTAIGPKTIRTSEFQVTEVDAGAKDILVALSTDVVSGGWNGNGSVDWGGGFAGVRILVDDIVLENGPPPVNVCGDIPPVEPAGPLIAGDSVVRVAGVGASADLVTVYINGEPEPRGVLDTSVLGEGTLTVTISGVLLKGDVVTATQWYKQGGTGPLIEGCAAAGSAVVGTGPNPNGVYLTLGVKETNPSAAIGGDGGVGTGSTPIEWVGATSVSNGRPVGGKLVQPSNDWQTVSFYLWYPTAGTPPAGYVPDPVLSYQSGNGVLEATGFGEKKGVLEHLAIVPASNDTGPYTLYIDQVKAGSSAGPIILAGGFDGYNAGTEQVMFRDPRYLLLTKAHLIPEPAISVIDDTQAADGTAKSLRVELQFADQGATRWCRLTTYSLYGIPSGYVPNPIISLRRELSFRVKLIPKPCKATAAVDVVRPLLTDMTTVNVTGVDTVNATKVTVYSNGVVIGSVTGAAGTLPNPCPVTTTALVDSEFVYATQTANGVESCLEMGQKVNACAQTAAVSVSHRQTTTAPIVDYRLIVGQTQVEVINVDPTAQKVAVYADGVKIGENTAPGGAAEVVVTTSPLVGGTRISATQTIQGLEGCVSTGGTMVGDNENSPLMLSLLIRETNPRGLVGEDGGYSNAPPVGWGQEWLGATGKLSNSAPIGKPIVPGPDWQTVKFDPTTDPILNFLNGDNGWNGATKAVLDSIALVNDQTSPGIGPYTLYIDSVTSGATSIGDFENKTVGSTVMFRVPNYSGSTDQELLTPPNASAVDGNVGYLSDQSERVEWRFVDDATTHWLRLTTYYSTRPEAHYIRNWLILGPFTGAADWATAHATDWLSGDGGEATVQPENGTVSASGKTWAVHSDSDCLIDWDAIWTDQTIVSSYAVAYVYNHGAQRTGELWSGSDDAARAWWNGAMVLDDNALSGHVWDANTSSQFQVLAGWNTLVMKVSENTGGYSHSCRLMDPATGMPMVDVGYATTKTATPSAWNGASTVNNWNPIVDLTQPITLRVLLLRPGDQPPCVANDPFADLDGDQDVDEADFAVFQRCFSGVGGGIYSGCQCLNRDGDNDVDSDDAGFFEACASGAGIAADPLCDGAP